MNVTIAVAQYPITEHKSFQHWAKHLENWVADAVKQSSQLLLFPEYGSMELVSLFPEEIRIDIKQQVIELNSLKNDFCTVFSDLAKKYKTIIIAPTIPIIDAGKRVNRAFVFSQKGLIGYQDKFFMTRFENEDWGIEPGVKNLALFEASWGNFGIQICYDVEFSIGSHHLSSAGANLILAPSCTETIRGATRVHVGARARALENQSFVAVAQTVGDALWSPAVDVNYGFAAFYCTPDKNMPAEGVLSTMVPQTVGWLVQSVDFSRIEMLRNDGQVFNYKDQQTLHTSFLNEKLSLARVVV